MEDKKTNGTPSFHEFCQHLIQKRDEQAKQNPALAEEDKSPMVEPIICRGVADIIVAEEEKEA